jgi:hypothetical protein
MNGDPRLYKLETAAERAIRERLALEKKGKWSATLDAQDRRLALNDVIRGPDKPSFSDSCKAWLGGHRF